MKAVLEGRHLTWQPLDKRLFYSSLLQKNVLIRLGDNPSFIKGVLLGVDHLKNHLDVGGAMDKIVLGTSHGPIIVRASSVLSIGKEVK